MFASEYSYTIDEFFQLTLKQLNFLIDRITARKQNEFATKIESYGAIHGAKIKIPRIEVTVDDPIGDNKAALKIKIEDDKAKDLLMRALAEKRKGG